MQTSARRRNPYEITEQMLYQMPSLKASIIATIDPEIFLDVTTTGPEHKQQIKDEAYSLEQYNKWARSGDTSFMPALLIEEWDNPDCDPALPDQEPFVAFIHGHEGRHRAAAAIANGERVMAIAVAIRPRLDGTEGAGGEWKSQAEAFLKMVSPDKPYESDARRRMKVWHLPKIITGQYRGSSPLLRSDLTPLYEMDPNAMYKRVPLPLNLQTSARKNPREGLTAAQRRMLLLAIERHFTPLGAIDYVAVRGKAGSQQRRTAEALQRKGFVAITKRGRAGEWQVRLSESARARVEPPRRENRKSRRPLKYRPVARWENGLGSHIELLQSIKSGAWHTDYTYHLPPDPNAPWLKALRDSGKPVPDELLHGTVVHGIGVMADKSQPAEEAIAEIEREWLTDHEARQAGGVWKRVPIPKGRRRRNPKGRGPWTGMFEDPDEPAYFHFLAGSWDTRKARQLVAARKGYHDKGTLDPNAWINMFGGIINIDPARVAAIDLEKSPPVIVAQMPDSSEGHRNWKAAFDAGQVSHMVIDGWHRMKRATELGLSELPAHLLTMDESYDARIDMFKDGPIYDYDEDEEEYEQDMPEGWGNGNGRANPIPASELPDFEEADLKVMYSAQPKRRASEGGNFNTFLYVTDEALERMGLRDRVYNETEATKLPLIPGYRRVGRISTMLLDDYCEHDSVSGRDATFVVSARLTDALHNRGLGAYLYTAAADEAWRRGYVLSSATFDRSSEASRAWASSRIAKHYIVELADVEDHREDPDSDWEDPCPEMLSVMIPKTEVKGKRAKRARKHPRNRPRRANVHDPQGESSTLTAAQQQLLLHIDNNRKQIALLQEQFGADDLAALVAFRLINVDSGFAEPTYTGQSVAQQLRGRRRRNPEEPLGNCYQLAAELVLDQDRWGKGGPTLTLVHGRPTLQRPPFIKYGHAWAEYDDPQGQRIVRDPVADVEMPAILYYSLGNIDPSENHYYTANEARIQMLKMKHWGPWEGPEAVGPIVPGGSRPRRNPEDPIPITEHEKQLAQWALDQLELHRSEVVLVPSKRGRGSIRVAIDYNPEFYRMFLEGRHKEGRRKKPRTKKGYRKQVTAALNRIVAGKPWEGEGWIGWQLLDILHELEERDIARGYEEPG